MIKYFRELLATLKSIDQRLEAIEKYMARLDKCVLTNHNTYGDRHSVSTKNFNS